MSRPHAILTRGTAMIAVCAVVVAGAQAGGAKTAAKGRPTSGSAYVAVTHTVNGKIYAAGSGIDKILGPAALTLVFSNPAPTSQPGVVKVTLKPMVQWLRTGTMTGVATVLVNLNTGKLTDGHATFTGRTGTQKGHTLVGSLHGSADLAKGRFHYTYTGVYK